MRLTCRCSCLAWHVLVRARVRARWDEQAPDCGIFGPYGCKCCEPTTRHEWDIAGGKYKTLSEAKAGCSGGDVEAMRYPKGTLGYSKGYLRPNWSCDLASPDQLASLHAENCAAAWSTIGIGWPMRQTKEKCGHAGWNRQTPSSSGDNAFCICSELVWPEY